MPVLPKILVLTAVSSALFLSLAATAQPATAPEPAKPAASSTPVQNEAAPAAALSPPAKIDPVAKLKQELGAVQSEKGLLVTLPADSLFDFNQASIRAEAAQTLEKLADLVRRLRKPVQVSGHTDTKGDDGYNKKLTQMRANAVKTSLVQRGIRAASIQTTGFGEARPKAANTNPDGGDNVKGQESNRRVEVLIPKG